MGELPLVDDSVVHTWDVLWGFPIASDKYRSITVALGGTAPFIGAPTPRGQRYVLTGLQLCDSAHRQLERVRQGIAVLRDEGFIGESGLQVPDQESEYRNHLAAATDAWAVIGDLHMAMTAVHTAIGMAITAPKRLGSPAAVPRVPRVPAVIRNAESVVKALRDACTHIDDRVFGLAASKNEEPLSIFDATSIFTRETFTYSGQSFDITRGATDLLITTRDYFLTLWRVLTRQAAVAISPGTPV
jgi:hypothetical protein